MKNVYVKISCVFSKMKLLYVIYLLLIAVKYAKSETCPSRCICDTFKSLWRARCINQKLINVNTGVPQAVQILDLSNNSISTINDFEFQTLNLIHLKHIILANNSINTIGLEAFADLKLLISLNIAFNHLEDLLPGIFWHNKHIQSLYLRGNKFWNIRGAFIESESLKSLDISRCQISYIHNGMFQMIPNLLSLDISDNMLIQIDYANLLPMNHLRLLKLLNNPWTCNNKLIEFDLWIKKRHIGMKPLCNQTLQGPKKFEKMIMHVSTSTPKEIEEVEIDTVWKQIIEIPNKSVVDSTHFTNNITSFRTKFNTVIPSDISFMTGSILGFLLGALFTYCIVICSCSLPKCTCLRIRTHRQRLREARVNNQESNASLWSNITADTTDTPPCARRSDRLLHFSQNNRSRVCWSELPTEPLRTNRESWEYFDGNRGNRVPPGTPPPPYRDVMLT